MTAIIEDYASIKRRMDEIAGRTVEFHFGGPVRKWSGHLVGEFTLPGLAPRSILTPEGQALLDKALEEK